MVVGIAPEFLILFLIVLFIAGAITGLAGFGFAMIGTMGLAIIIDPVTAVILMIIPIIGVNISLIRELSMTELRTCGDRFGPLLLAALIGTIVGLLILDTLPQNQLEFALGIFALAFVATSLDSFPTCHFSFIKETGLIESRPVMITFGMISGLIFGATNVGVQFVAYLRSRQLPERVFIGVIAMVFLGLNGIRVGIAIGFNFYPSNQLIVASVGAIIPAVIGVCIGKQLRTVISIRYRHHIVLILLSLIGIRLIMSGVGIG